MCNRHALRVHSAVRVAADAKLAGIAEHASTGARLSAEQRHPGPDDPGMVYFIRFRDSIKIGWSADVGSRLGNLPHEEVLHVQPGTQRDEKRLHAAFAHLRITGEWFRDAPDLRAFIADLCTT